MKLIIILLALSIQGHSQMQCRIDSILWKKGQTVFIRARVIKTDSLVYLPIYFRGLGKRPLLPGLKGTYHPNGIGRRRVHFTINED